MWSAVRARLVVASALALLLGAVADGLSADSNVAATPDCCWRAHNPMVGLDLGVVWALADEIVESLPDHATKHLSHLAWTTGTGAVGVSVGYAPWEPVSNQSRFPVSGRHERRKAGQS